MKYNVNGWRRDGRPFIVKTLGRLGADISWPETRYSGTVVLVHFHSTMRPQNKKVGVSFYHIVGTFSLISKLFG